MFLLPYFVFELKKKTNLDYNSYYNLILTLAKQGSTTGTDQSREKIEATHLNVHRMMRHNKHSHILPEIEKELRHVKNKWKWMIISEAWCGDGAQNIPIIAKIAQIMPNVSLQFILRDEHPEIIDAHLTNGTRAIPKLICYNEAEVEIGSWGPRPANIQKNVHSLKQQQPGISHEDLVKNIHLWYARDKGQSIQFELFELIKKWQGNQPVAG